MQFPSAPQSFFLLSLAFGDEDTHKAIGVSARFWLEREGLRMRISAGGNDRGFKKTLCSLFS